MNFSSLNDFFFFIFKDLNMLFRSTKKKIQRRRDRQMKTFWKDWNKFSLQKSKYEKIYMSNVLH